MLFVNLTPHDVVVVDKNGTKTVYSKSGKVARVIENVILTEEIDGITVAVTSMDVVEGLPDPKEGVIYITSMPVAQMVKRNDVVSPDTGPNSAIRDDQGMIKAVMRLRRFV